MLPHLTGCHVLDVLERDGLLTWSVDVVDRMHHQPGRHHRADGQSVRMGGHEPVLEPRDGHHLPDRHRFFPVPISRVNVDTSVAGHPDLIVVEEADSVDTTDWEGRQEVPIHSEQLQVVLHLDWIQDGQVVVAGACDPCRGVERARLVAPDVVEAAELSDISGGWGGVFRF